MASPSGFLWGIIAIFFGEANSDFMASISFACIILRIYYFVADCAIIVPIDFREKWTLMYFLSCFACG
jgi:hypothetical protein